ncbi:MAG: UvrD-helicase domain-containing protein [Flavobacteriaceae bacterium]
MQQASTFRVYNASAGSGKTFTLVKEYLKILLATENVFTFQKVIAITFTNKAAAEMKERVLKNLKDFSEKKENSLSKVLLEEISIDVTTLEKRSKKVLNAILQNYSAFYITTIDSFTYKIIRSFAFDLGLSQNFEVQMDAQELLNEAVDLLISKIGTDEELTEVLIDYSLEKIDDDKSWDISRDLSEFSRILLNEEDVSHFRKLADKSLSDFIELRNKLRKTIKDIENKFSTIGVKGLSLIDSKGINHADFAYTGEVPKHFMKLKNLSSLKLEDLKFDGRINTNFENEKSISAGKASINAKENIEAVYEELKMLFFESKELYQKYYSNYAKFRAILKSVIPLAVLNNINQELSTIKEDGNIRLNAEFNQLISDNIQGQPAPFIYERIGQKFMHYFIDEMQDTSVLQWNNLIPLIDNSLSQEKTSLLLVGDGKQAIYRWRGGKAAQFIGLGSDDAEAENPFLIEKEVRALETNYRSYSEVINFNNSFFRHSSQFLNNESYKHLFLEKSFQKENHNKGGYVSLSLIDKLDDKEEDKLKYATKVYETIQQLDPKFSLGDVCVLVRKRSEGVLVANYLSEKGIEIVSSETLLLSTSKKVNFIISFLQFVLFPNDKESLLDALDFLYHHLNIEIDKHTFFENHVHLEMDALFESLKKHDYDFNISDFYLLPFYEKIEQIIRSFQLLKTSDAYVQFFLDEVLSQQKKESSIQDFLDFWNLKKDVLSIVSSEGSNAVKIMTIHKSKGLEFPIVIFPCDLDIYQEIKPKIWLDTAMEGFSELMVPLNKEVQHISKQGKELYDQRRELLELDSFNMLYVALTRAIEQLYIITEKKLSKGIEKTNYYSGIFISFLKEKGIWNEDQEQYDFGEKNRLSEVVASDKIVFTQERLISTPWKDHQINLLASSSKLWGTETAEAREYGDLIHEIMSHIITLEDVDPIVNSYVQSGQLRVEDFPKVEKMIQSIVNHEKLNRYFSSKVRVYNEREIVDENQQILIPDRLVFEDEKNVIIIDYKTGQSSRQHHHQLSNYENVLQSLGFHVDKKVLIYIGESIMVEEI